MIISSLDQSGDEEFWFLDTFYPVRWWENTRIHRQLRKSSCCFMLFPFFLEPGSSFLGLWSQRPAVGVRRGSLPPSPTALSSFN